MRQVETSAGPAVPPMPPAPALYVITGFKIAKGMLFFAFGALLYWKSATDIAGDYERFLRTPAIVGLFHLLRIHPENQFFTNLAAKIGAVSVARFRATGVGTMIWSLFPLVEGLGLMFRFPWAGWLAIGESAFFVPIELLELTKRFNSYLLGVTLINALIVWYLYANRDWLFRHRHERPVSD